jgi:hypothetical protein
MNAPFAYPLFGALIAGLSVVGVVRAIRASTAHRAWVIGALIVWLGALLYMTARPGSGGVRLNLVPVIVDGPGSARDAVLNVIVFLPLGLLLATIGARVLPVIGLACAVSLGIEVMQYLLAVGRTADVNDVITNVAGAGIGWALAELIQTRGYRERRIAS